MLSIVILLSQSKSKLQHKSNQSLTIANLNDKKFMFPVFLILLFLIILIVKSHLMNDTVICQVDFNNNIHKTPNNYLFEWGRPNEVLYNKLQDVED